MRIRNSEIEKRMERVNRVESELLLRKDKSKLRRRALDLRIRAPPATICCNSHSIFCHTVFIAQKQFCVVNFIPPL